MSKSSDSFADDVMPEIVEAPVVMRSYKALAWHRPRKQFIREKQWNHYLIEKLIKKIDFSGDRQAINMLGLPSEDFLDLLSLQSVCEEHDVKVKYLGFNSTADGDIEGLYQKINRERMLEASSFIHPGSRLVSDRFENITNRRDFATISLNSFPSFDIVNLDLCGCILEHSTTKAGRVLDAVTELINRQATARLEPWLFFVTSYAFRDDIALDAFNNLLSSLVLNVESIASFREKFKTEFQVEIRQDIPRDELPHNTEFIELFTLAFGKWLAAKLKHASPASFAMQLPTYMFRHQNFPTPRLVSVGYLVEPAPKRGKQGWLNFGLDEDEDDDDDTRYEKSVVRMISQCKRLRDLDEIVETDDVLYKQLTERTKELLVGCGYDPAEVELSLPVEYLFRTDGAAGTQDVAGSAD